MSEPILAAYTGQMTEILQDLICIIPRLRAILPEHMAQLKERLGELSLEGKLKRTAGYGSLFYQIGLVLSRQSEPVTMGELSMALAVPLSTATRLVDWLVESGYADRRPDPEDRRIVRVELTAAGRELYQAINEFLKQRVEQVLDQFTAEECQDLIVLLRKLVRALGHMAE